MRFDSNKKNDDECPPQIQRVLVHQRIFSDPTSSSGGLNGRRHNSELDFLASPIAVGVVARSEKEGASYFDVTRVSNFFRCAGRRCVCASIFCGHSCYVTRPKYTERGHKSISTNICNRRTLAVVAAGAPKNNEVRFRNAILEAQR